MLIDGPLKVLHYGGGLAGDHDSNSGLSIMALVVDLCIFNQATLVVVVEFIMLSKAHKRDGISPLFLVSPGRQ